MPSHTKPVVFVMLSGGVDSSVAAAELLTQGYEVVGVFMKCWSIEQLTSLGASPDLYGCFWEEDSDDARQVATKLGIPFYVWNFEQDYKQKVVDYMLNEYRQGLTPNPDIMCNSQIKFGVFYHKARSLGADFVATGHYARIMREGDRINLGRAKDKHKDQSYFLARIDQEVLVHTLMPVGEFASKAEVRQRAKELGLVTAQKPDSQGLCFIGHTPLRQLLLQVLGQKPGQIVDTSGQVLGQHQGAYLFTIGQRFGLGLSGGPWFVTRIDIDQNQVEVTHATSQTNLYTTQARIKNLNWLSSDYTQKSEFVVMAQSRYRQTPLLTQVKFKSDQNQAEVFFSKPVRAITPGQSLVLYDQDVVVGSGVISI